MASAEYMRSYRSDPERARKHRESSRRWREANRNRHRAYQSAYAVAHPEQVRDWQRAHPDRVAASHRKARYGITDKEYAAQLALQDGVCALCRRPETATGRTRLAVDHDHETGLMRGLLCIGCNISLGYFERGWRSRLDPEIVEAYLGGGWTW